MSTFDERQQAFEAKFAHDAELLFRAEARRNRLVGIWAGEMLGKKGDAMESYIRDVIKTDFQRAGDEVVLEKLAKDLEGMASREDIREKLDTCFATAKAQVIGETS